MEIVVINGRPRAGKDLFVFCCKAIAGERCFSTSTVDIVKELATQAGWDGEKNAKNREFLSDLKDLLTKWNDVPYDDVVRKIREWELLSPYKKDKLIAFIHCREPEEIQKFVDRLGAITLLIKRPETDDNITSNHADENVFDYEYDYTIMNDSTKEELLIKAKEWLKTIEIIPYN